MPQEYANLSPPTTEIGPFANENPFRERIRQRQAAKGGKHRASEYLDGRLARAEETLIEPKRVYFEMRDQVTCPF